MREKALNATTLSVELTMSCMKKGEGIVYLANKSKPVHYEYHNLCQW